MTQVYVKYNPYRLQTIVQINGRDVPTDSMLFKVTRGKRLQEWIGAFPKMLREELNTVDFSLEFHGLALDWDDFREAFAQAQAEGIVNFSDIKYIEGKSDDDINNKIVSIFEDLQNGPLDDFRDAKLQSIFERINDAIFPVNVIATMSSGKSTLINALLARKLMPSKNEACTATITEILDADDPVFRAVVFNENEEEIAKIPELTYQIMDQLNSDSDSNNLILYVLNGTQLSTNDDAALLRYVADQIKKGGKQVRDRFLFVINKMDQFNPQEEGIESAIDSAKRYLALYGIDDPQLFPCSAFAALNIRTELSGIDIDNLTRQQEKQLSRAAKDALYMIDKFMESDSMHLEQYTTLSPSAQQELNYRLSQAIENGDTKEQALIHSGICSIEAAITAYVKKYAKTKKIKDLVESLQEVLNKVLARAKEQVAVDEAAVQACMKRAETVKQKIADGEEAKHFKAREAPFDDLFSAMFGFFKLNDELGECAADRTKKEENLRKNEKILNWIETNMDEIETILDM